MKRISLILSIFYFLYGPQTLCGQTPIKEFVGPVDVVINDVAISPSNNTALVGLDNGVAMLWSVSDNKIIQEYDEHDSSIRAVAFSPKYPLIVTASDDAYIKIWREDQNNSIATLEKHQQSVTSLSFSKDGQYMVSGSFDGQIILWSVSKDGLKFKGEFHNEGKSTPVNDVSFSPDGQYVVVGYQDGMLAMWRRKSKGEPVKKLNGHEDYVNKVSFSYNQNYFFSGSDDGKILKWSIKESKKSSLANFNYHDDNVFDLAVTSDNKWLVSCGSGGKLIIGDIAKNRIIKHYDHPPNAYNITSLSLSKNDKFILTGASDGIARLWLLNYSIPDTIEWLNPSDVELTVYSETFELKASINTSSRIKNLFFYHDGERVPALKGLGIRPDNIKKQYFERTIQLNRGENQFAVEVHLQNENILLSKTIIVNYPELPPIDSSNNYLLLIGADQYTYWNVLYNPIKDLTDIKDELFTHYRFEEEHTIQLLDTFARYHRIEDAFRNLKTKVRKHDNLIIYYSGHGYYERDFSAGYIVTQNAKKKTTEKYIPYATLLNWLGGIKCRHIYLMLDACYAGKMFENSRRGRYIEKYEKIPSRRAVTSGFDMVSDGFPGTNSPFTKVFLKYLKTNRKKPFPCSSLEQYLRIHVHEASPETSQKVFSGPLKMELENDIIPAKSGEFVFRPKK